MDRVLAALDGGPWQRETGVAVLAFLSTVVLTSPSTQGRQVIGGPFHVRRKRLPRGPKGGSGVNWPANHKPAKSLVFVEISASAGSEDPKPNWLRPHRDSKGARSAGRRESLKPCRQSFWH